MRNLHTIARTLCGGMFLALAATSGAEAQAWLTIDLPDFNNGMIVNGPINGNNTFVGFYTSTDGSNPVYIRTSDGTLTTFTATDGIYASMPALNANDDIAVTYSDSSNNDFGYLRTAAGVITKFSINGSTNTEAVAINDSDTIAGEYLDSVTHRYTGFVRTVDGGVKTFPSPNSDPLLVNAISNRGCVAGTYGGNGHDHGFVRGIGGKITTFDIANASSISVVTLTNGGVVAGTYGDNSNITHGFIRQADGTIVTIDDPNTSGRLALTQVFGMNDDGIVVGYYMDSHGTRHGFARSPDGTTFVTLDAPLGAHGTEIDSIGPNGKMTGQYTDANGGHHLVRVNAAVTGF